MTSKKVHVTEVVLRDAHQSLLATRMRTADMLPACAKLDSAGFWSLEAWGGATFDACLRFLKEDPWERLRKLKAALPNTPIQMLLRGQNLLGYRHYSDDVVEAFVQKAARNGVDVFRIFDAMNDMRNLEVSVKAVLKAGKHAQGAICYTTGPVHTVEHFVEQAKALEKLGCHSIVIKDMAGLLTPARTIELFSALSKAVKLPLAFHSHTTVGVANICMYLAVEHGARHVDTAISSLSWGTSHSPTESMVVAFRNTPYDTGLDLGLLQEIGFYFREVRKKYRQFESEYAEIDTRVQVNQVPGGMISNLSNQLKEQGALNRMNEVLAEIPKVRADLGFPPLVTPTSQIVGTQAVLNVLTGKRYKSITNEVKLYLQGRYGKAPGKINDAVRKLAIGGDEVITCRPADRLKPEIHRLREDIGELAKSEEDVLTFAMFPEIGRKFLEERAAGTLKPEELRPPVARGAGHGRDAARADRFQRHHARRDVPHPSHRRRSQGRRLATLLHQRGRRARRDTDRGAGRDRANRGRPGGHQARLQGLEAPEGVEGRPCHQLHARHGGGRHGESRRQGEGRRRRARHRGDENGERGARAHRRHHQGGQRRQG